MREYILYVKETRAAYKALITPCFSLDQTFWEQHDGSQLHILGRSTSLALIFALRQQVQLLLTTQLRFEQLRSQIHIHLQKYLKELNGQLPDGHAFKFTSELYNPNFLNDPHESDEFPHMRSDYDVADQKQTAAVIRSQAMKLAQSLSGRSLLLEEIEYSTQIPTQTLFPCLQWLVLTGVTDWQPGITIQLQKSWWRHKVLFTCQRCGAPHEDVMMMACQSCGQPCAYCPLCLAMGRSRCCTPYICLPNEQIGNQNSTSQSISANQSVAILPSSIPTMEHSLLKWNGSFSSLQADAAQRALNFVKDSVDSAFLIWAVCGAGKTELIFPAVNEVLMKGGKVLLATPRKDVVLELVPRLRQVFPDVTIRAAYGSSKEKWEEGQFIISTTHQTMRFYHSFQLVIVDEVDAFPFHNNVMLYRAVERARKPGGNIIYLSATPPTYLRKRLVPVRSAMNAHHSMTHVLIPQRYHGFPLPIPHLLIAPRWHQKLHQEQRIVEVNDLVTQSLADNRQVFVFVPKIADVQPVLQYFRIQFPEYTNHMEGVHAADELREDKVLEFRKRKYRLLVTTTILERGVTIPRSDVIVLGADESVFDEASLVQIAGRVGRSADSPDGKILFVLKDRSKSPLQAIKQIKQMNHLASRNPLLASKERG
ncbi:DEAD/DEAH box helicase [Brevibacillus ginsengisoli]|uniref:DEAD/DEAH box helicase n=1 Tax=Brevibacillus ginsengisoli TaxID=363854 RepID=UPI003CF5A8C1